MRSNSKPVTQRQRRVAEQVRHILAECFQRGDVPDSFLNMSPVSVMEVRISPDFSYCKAYLSVLSIQEEDTLSLVKALNKQSGYFRKHLAVKMRLRTTPEVRFFADGAQEEADKIDALLASEKVMRDVLVVREED